MSGFGVFGYGAAPFGGGEALMVELLASSASAIDLVPLPTPYRVMASEATATESIASLLAAVFSDTANATDNLAPYLRMLEELLDTAEANEQLRLVMTEVLADDVTATDATATILSRYALLRDVLLATDATATTLSASNLLFAVAVATDALSTVMSASLTSGADATDTLLDRLVAIAQLFAEAEASSSISNTLSMVAFIDDEADATDSLTNAGQFLGLLESGATAAIILRLGGAEYSAWVLNTENVAVSQYNNYPFNSFAELNGNYYGASSDGLYLLDGDDDAGTAIQAYFRSPLTDFGNPNLKRLPEVYFGYTSSGDMVCKTTVTSLNGVKEEHWYRLEARPAATVGATRETRVPVGKGLKSVYWQFELHNINGADFEINTSRFWPMVLTRRVR